MADNTSRVLVMWTLLVVPWVAALFSQPVLLGLFFAFLSTIGFVVASYVVARVLLRLPWTTPSDYMYGWMAFLGWILGLQRSSYLVENVTSRRTVESGGRLFPGVVLVDGHSAIVTRSFDQHHRVLGPGVHFREPTEVIPVKKDGKDAAKVGEVVDLRRQFRIVPLQAQTRDGMFIKSMLYTIFQIDRDADRALDEQNYFRFYDAAVQRAVMAERVGADGQPHDWTTVPPALAQDAALQIISTYELDELYAPRADRDSFHPMQRRRELGTQIADAIREDLKGHGIQLIAAGVTKIEPADARVTLQRVLNWRARRHREVLERQALSEAAAEAMREAARDEANRALLLAILTGLSNAKGQSRALLQLRLAAALEHMYTPPRVAAPLPELPGDDEVRP